MIENPLENADIQQLLSEGTLTYEDLGLSSPPAPSPSHDPRRPAQPNVLVDPGTGAVIVAEAATTEFLGPLALVLIIVTVVAAPKDRPASKTVKVTKVVGKVAKVTGPVIGPWAGCLFDYMGTWASAHDTNPRGCAKVVHDLMSTVGFNEEDAGVLNRHFGVTTDRFLLRSRRGLAVNYGHFVFETTVGEPRITYFPNKDYPGLLRGGYDKQLDVPSMLVPPGRLMLPLRAFEAGGAFQVDYFPKAGMTELVTLTRVSDGLTITYTIGSTNAKLSNGTSLLLDVPPLIVEGRTMLPFRASFTPFCTVDWFPYIQVAAANCVP